MDPVEAWIDAEEVTRLAESLTASSDPSQLLDVKSSEAAFGEDFIGFDAKRPKSGQALKATVDVLEEKKVTAEEPPKEVEKPIAPKVEAEDVEVKAAQVDKIQAGEVESIDEAPLPDLPEPSADQEKAIVPPAVSAVLAAAASSAIMGPIVRLKAEGSDTQKTEAKEVSDKVAQERETPLEPVSSSSGEAASFSDTSHLSSEQESELKGSQDSENPVPNVEDVASSSLSSEDDDTEEDTEEDREALQWLKDNGELSEEELAEELGDEKSEVEIDLEVDEPTEASPLPQPYPFGSKEVSKAPQDRFEEVKENQLNPVVTPETPSKTSETPSTSTLTDIPEPEASKKIKPFDTPTKPVSSFPASDTKAVEKAVSKEKEVESVVILEGDKSIVSPFKEVIVPLGNPVDLPLAKVAPSPSEETESKTPHPAEAPSKAKPADDVEVSRDRDRAQNSDKSKESPIQLANPFGIKSGQEIESSPSDEESSTEPSPEVKEVTPLEEPPGDLKATPQSTETEKPSEKKDASSTAPFLTRLEEFGNWLKEETPTEKFFILDRDGKILIDEVESLNLQKISRTLANHTIAVQRRGGEKANPSAHLKIGDASYLEVIPTKSKYGNLILGCIVPESMPPEGAKAIAHNLLVTANQGA